MTSQTEQMEHAIYNSRQAASEKIEAVVASGMTREEVETAIAPVLADWGKQARKSLRKEAYKIAGLGNPADYHEDKGHLTKSNRGTYATVIGGRSYAMTKAECESRGLKPGPGNF